MAQFDESKVINTLHPEKVEVGKKYWYADNINNLKSIVEHDDMSMLDELRDICTENGLFEVGSVRWYLLYPYEEPPKKRMTYRQLSEWLAKGNGQYTMGGTIYHDLSYNNCDNAGEHTLRESYKIRHWDSEEWIEPTVDIYERDCKGVTK